jgi:hypothetical protein
MNCEDVVFTREETIQFTKKEILRAQLELLDWAMGRCYSGSTPSMIRRDMHNKRVELSGEGEKA